VDAHERSRRYFFGTMFVDRYPFDDGQKAG
jgi:hypothetical protein